MYPEPNKQTNEVIFSRKSSSSNLSCPPIKFNNNDISECPHQKHLVIDLDSKLHLNAHVDQQQNKTRNFNSKTWIALLPDYLYSYLSLSLSLSLCLSLSLSQINYPLRSIVAFIIKPILSTKKPLNGIILQLVFGNFEIVLSKKTTEYFKMMNSEKTAAFVNSLKSVLVLQLKQKFEFSLYDIISLKILKL